jgi:hypothetical protein
MQMLQLINVILFLIYSLSNLTNFFFRVLPNYYIFFICFCFREFNFIIIYTANLDFIYNIFYIILSFKFLTLLKILIFIIHIEYFECIYLFVLFVFWFYKIIYLNIRLKNTETNLIFPKSVVNPVLLYNFLSFLIFFDFFITLFSYLLFFISLLKFLLVLGYLNIILFFKLLFFFLIVRWLSNMLLS